MAKTDKTSNIYVDGSQAGKTLNQLRKESRRLNNEINQMAPGTEAYKKKVQELGGVKKQLTDHRNEIKKVEGSYKKVRGSMGMIKNMVGGFLGAGAIMGAVRGIAGTIGNWIKTNAQLSASLSSLRSITGASTKDVQFYKEEAIRMGKETTQSATQVVDAMKLIGSAKPELLSNKKALSDVTEETIRLAEAGEINMQAAADSLTGSLNQWGEGANEAGRFTNVLAAGSKAGAANIENLGKSIDKSGAVMAGYNVNIEQGVGLLETMAERNLKGAEAGTQLRNVLLTMQGVDALPSNAIAQLEKYGVNTDIVKDKTQPLNARLAEMAKISGDATAMMEVFGRENIVAAGAILENTDKVQSFTDAVTGTNTALEQQKINNDNLQGDMKQLSSAWEGFILTVGSGEGIIRKFVQAITWVINGVTHLITVFAEWDTLEMETMFLKANRGLLFFNKELQRNLDRQIRINEVSQQMIDKLEGQSRNFNILTNALKDNNKSLEKGNLNEKEAAKLKSENEQIISSLQEKYPELTKEIDLQSMSNEQLIEWQTKANDSLIENIAKEVEAAEKKRILNDIIKKQIELDRRQAEESIGFWNQLLGMGSGLGGQALKDAEISIAKDEIKQLGVEYDETGKVIQKAMQNVKGMNLNFAEDFDITTDNIEKQRKKVEELGNAIETAQKNNKKIPEQIKAQYQGMLEALKGFEDEQQRIKDEALQEEKEAREKAAEEAAAAASAKAKEAAEAKEKELEKLRDRLQDLAEFEKEIQLEKNREIALAGKEGLDKELQEQKFAIEDKYKAQIESARQLAQEKGKIGAQAADQLATLEALQEEELANAKAEIQAKARENQKEEEEKAAQERAEAKIRIEDALWNTKMTLLQIKLSETGEFEVDKRREILEQISALEREKAQRDLDRQKENLRLQFENEEISKEEFDLRKEELEALHQQRLTEIKKEASEERKAIQEEEIQNTIDSAQMAVNVVKEFQKAEQIAAMARIEERSQARIDELDRALSKNEISQRQYDEAVAQIEQEADNRKKKLAIEEFERTKKLSLVQVAIDTASAIMSAIAKYGPPPSPMGIAGIIAATGIGVAQTSAIMSQQPPQFAEGGFTTVTGAEDGKIYNAKIRGKAKAGMLPGGPQLVLANEKGPEYFIPNPMLSDPEVIDHVRAIENIRVRQFAEGGATAQITENSAPVDVKGLSEEIMQEMIRLLQSNKATINELRKEIINMKVVIGDQNIDQLMQRMDEINKMRA